MKIVTHNASFHADDVFSISALLILYPEAQVLRTRDVEIIRDADIVVDVGGVYDSETNRFDHHQKDGAGKRENGIPYSSFGILWKKFGEEICGSSLVMKRIDESLVQTIDAADNGVDLYQSFFPGVYPYLIHGVLDQYRLTWKEKGDWDESFDKCVLWTKSFLERMIKMQGDIVEGEKIVQEEYLASSDKRVVLIKEKYDLGRQLVTNVLSALPEPLYAVLYRQDHHNWQIVAMRKASGSFELRKPLPEVWRAKQDEEFEKVSGVVGAKFCHRNGFMCIANSKEAVLKLVESALNA